MAGASDPASSADAAVPHAPWRLRGRVVLGWLRAPAGLLDAGQGVGRGPRLRRSLGPAVVVAVAYTDSPVGPYDELTVAVPARLGLRPGLAAVITVVNNGDARRGAQRNWGIPAEVAALRWHDAPVDGTSTLVWEDRAIAVTGQPVGPVLPFLVPMRSVQRRSDGPVVVPRRLWGRMRVARTTVSVDPEDDMLGWLDGVHPGAVLEGMRMVVQPARHPIGLLSTLRAPLRAPEPALVGEPLQ